MFLAGRSFYEIDVMYRQRMRVSYMISAGFFLLGALITPLSCVPDSLRPKFLGHRGPRRVAEFLTPPERTEASVEAMAARWRASGAMQVIDFVIAEEGEDPDFPAPQRLADNLEPARARRGPSVSIGELIPLETVQIEIELDENLTARTTSLPSARDEDFAIMHMIRPDYPQISLWDEVEGLITIKATVDPTGRVSRVKTLSNEADAFCEEVAARALLQWKFSPLKLHGRAVWFNVIVPFRFTLAN